MKGSLAWIGTWLKSAASRLIACNGNPIVANTSELEEVRPYDAARSYWRHRQKALFDGLLQIAKGLGDPETRAAVREGDAILEQMDAVCQDSQQMQNLDDRLDYLCSCVVKFIWREVPGGAAIVREVDRCEAILVLMENAANGSYAQPQQAASLSSLATQGPSPAEGVSDWAVISLPSTSLRVLKGLPSNDGKKASACSICLAEFGKGQLVSKLPKCGHIFHAHCMDRWVRMRNACPLCRIPAL